MALRRRRRRRRPRPRRFPWLAFGVIAVVVVGLWWSVNAIKRQIAGYFEPTRSAHHGKRAVPSGARVATTSSPVRVTSPEPTQQRPLTEAKGPLALTHPPMVAIIIDDCGNNLAKDEQFLGLPAQLTLAILPLTAHGREIAQEAAAAGKSIMLHLPMQPESSEHNPGPGAITISMTDAQIALQVEADLASLPPVPGANNHMGSKGTSDPRVMHDVLEALKSKHLFFIDSETTNASLGAQMAREMGLLTAARDVFLDNDLSEPAIEAQLRETQKVAIERGQAIAIGHPNAETAIALAKMIPQMQAAGIEFVSAETLVK